MKPCGNCGSVLHHRKQLWMEEGQVKEACSDCIRIKMTPCYDDVYLGPGKGMKTDMNICDPKTGREIPFQTKQDKAIAMKIAGVKQANSAERQHGFRNEELLHRPKYFEIR